MVQTVIEPEASEIPDVDLDAEIPCQGLINVQCPHPAQWVWYFDCGATGKPICDLCHLAFADLVAQHLGEKCYCIPHNHLHLVSEINYRRL